MSSINSAGNSNQNKNFGEEISDFASRKKILIASTLGLALVGYVIFKGIKRAVSWLKSLSGTAAKVNNTYSKTLSLSSNTSKISRINFSDRRSIIEISTQGSVDEVAKRSLDVESDWKKDLKKTLNEDYGLSYQIRVILGADGGVDDHFRSFPSVILEKFDKEFKSLMLQCNSQDEIIVCIENWFKKNCENQSQIDNGTFIIKEALSNFGIISKDKVPQHPQQIVKFNIEGLEREEKTTLKTTPEDIKQSFLKNKDFIKVFIWTRENKPEFKKIYNNFEYFFGQLLACTTVKEIAKLVDSLDLETFQKIELKKHLMKFGLIDYDDLIPASETNSLISDIDINNLNSFKKTVIEVDHDPLKLDADQTGVINECLTLAFNEELKLKPFLRIEDFKKEFYNTIKTFYDAKLLTDRSSVINLFYKAYTPDRKFVDTYELGLIYRTLKQAADLIKNKDVEKDLRYSKTGIFYKEKAFTGGKQFKTLRAYNSQKKNLDSYSFFICKEPKSFIISFDKLSSGSFKKVTDAFDVTNNKDMVKKTVERRHNEIEEALNELKIQDDISRITIHVLPLSVKAQIDFTKTVKENTALGVRAKATIFKQKLIYFEDKMVGSAEQLVSVVPTNNGTVTYRPPSLMQIYEGVLALVKGLADMHANGFIHLDIKPANLLLTPSGSIKIADFGTVKREGMLVGGFTPLYLKKDGLQSYQRFANPTYDRYAAGLTIMGLLSYYYLGGEKLTQDLSNIYYSLDHKNELNKTLFNLKNNLIQTVKSKRLDMKQEYQELYFIDHLIEAAGQLIFNNETVGCEKVYEVIIDLKQKAYEYALGEVNKYNQAVAYSSSSQGLQRLNPRQRQDRSTKLKSLGYKQSPNGLVQLPPEYGILGPPVSSQMFLNMQNETNIRNLLNRLKYSYPHYNANLDVEDLIYKLKKCTDGKMAAALIDQDRSIPNYTKGDLKNYLISIGLI